MKRVLALMVLIACDDGSSGVEPGVDGGAGSDSGSAADAGPPPDAAPVMESCTAAGWCAAAQAPNFTHALSVTASGQPWIASFGAYRRKANTPGWDRYEVSYADLVDPFRFFTELYTVHALSPTDVWIGGEDGYVAHFDGVVFQEKQRMTAHSSTAMWGATTNDVWLVFWRLRYRWDGSQLVASGTSPVEINGMWGSAANDVYAWGETEVTTNSFRPAFERWDGTAWTTTIVPGFGEVTSLWAASPTDIWAVVNLNGTRRLVRGSGDTWTTISDPAVTQINAVWGRSATEVWAVGQGGRIVRWNGTSWSTSASGTTTTLTEIGGTASTIWTIGDNVALHRDP